MSVSVDHHQALFEAIERGDMSSVRTLLETWQLTVDTIVYFLANFSFLTCIFFSDSSYVLSATCTRKPTLLIIAAAFSQLTILQWLLQQGANPNVCDVRLYFTKFFLNFPSSSFSDFVSCFCSDIPSTLLRSRATWM
jgi:hypothetical protein